MTPRQLTMLIAVSSIWGASYLLIAIALDGFDPAMIVFTRVALAALLLYAVIALRGGATRQSLSFLREHPVRVFVQGTLGVALPFALITYGQEHISSGLTGILVSPGPLFVAMFAPLIDPSERVNLTGWIGLVVGFGGVVVLFGGGTVETTAQVLAALAVLGAACSYGLGSMYAKLRFAGVPPLVVSFASVGAASILTAGPAIATLPGTSPDLGEILALASLGVIGTALAFVLYYSLIGEIGAGRATLVGYLIPPAAVLYGALLLDEVVTTAAILGLALILVGVAFGGRKRELDREGVAPVPELDRDTAAPT